MMDSLKFEIFDSKKNLAEQRALFKDCFPETNGDSVQTEKHYMWKFHTFPSDGDRSWEYATYLDKEMVGYYAALPYKYKIAGEKTSVGMVCDVMTSLHHRGQGIFTKLGRYATGELANNVPITMGYPIRKSVIPGHLKVGWKIAFELPLYMRFLKLNSLLASKHLGVLRYVLNPILSLYSGVINILSTSKYSCEVCSSIDDVEGYSKLVRKWSDEIPNALDKNLEFAKWRYGAPGRSYSFVGAYNNLNELVGFASCRFLVREGVPSLCVMDYMVLYDYKDCCGSIINALTCLAKEKGAEVIMTMMNRTSASNYKLVRHGFFKSPFTFYLIIKKLTDRFADAELYDEQKWHLMWVDSDDL